MHSLPIYCRQNNFVRRANFWNKIPAKLDLLESLGNLNLIRGSANGAVGHTKTTQNMNYTSVVIGIILQVLSRILDILQDKTLFCAFEAGDFVCWLVNPPIAKLDLFKSADCRWICKTYTQYCIEIQQQSADLYKVQLCNQQFFVGVPAIYVVKVYECHPLGFVYHFLYTAVPYQNNNKNYKMKIGSQPFYTSMGIYNNVVLHSDSIENGLKWSEYHFLLCQNKKCHKKKFGIASFSYVHATKMQITFRHWISLKL